MVLCLSEVDEFISKANDKLISSKILFDNQQYATSVSAAYYCMFLTAKALLIKKDYNPKSHEGLISLFGQVYVNQVILIGKLPNILHAHNPYVKMLIMMLLMELLKALQNYG